MDKEILTKILYMAVDIKCQINTQTDDTRDFFLAEDKD